MLRYGPYQSLARELQQHDDGGGDDEQARDVSGGDEGGGYGCGVYVARTRSQRGDGNNRDHHYRRLTSYEPIRPRSGCLVQLEPS